MGVRVDNSNWYVDIVLVHQKNCVFSFLGFLVVRWNAEDATEKHLVPSPRCDTRRKHIEQSNHWFDIQSRPITKHTN